MPIPDSAKQLLRPLIFAARQAAWRGRRLFVKPTPWDGRHHPVIERFAPWSGEADGTFFYDSLGVRTDPRFRPQFRPQPAGPLATAHPPPHNAYFELVFVLESVLSHAEAPRFRMLELGAGYGFWLVTAHRAVQQSSNVPLELVGIEMVPEHFQWMGQHFRNNDLDPAAHTLIHAAVSDYDGTARFRRESDRRLDFGQRVSGRIGGEPGAAAPAESGQVSVPCLDLARFLDAQAPFDLVHVDIQGEELRALSHAWPQIDRKVGRLLVGTHSRRTHGKLKQLISDSGWTPIYDFGFRKRVRTEYGDVQFLDGMLAFVNPRPLRS